MSKITAFGVPEVVWLLAMSATGLSGAAAIAVCRGKKEDRGCNIGRLYDHDC